MRITLLVALLALGGWGMLTAVTEVSKAYTAYRQSQDLIVWVRTTNHLFRMAQHFSFERGRTATVLRDPQPISTENRRFLDQRRLLADQAMQEFLRDRHLLPDVGQERLVPRWEAIQAMRLEVDRNAALPLARRDPALAEHWFENATLLLTDSRKMTQQLVSGYVRYRGLELARLTLVMGYAFEMRVTLGAESALIAQSLVGRKQVEAQTLARIHELRGNEQMIWEEINRLRRYAPIPGIEATLDKAWRTHKETMQPMQDSLLATWGRGKKSDISMEALIASFQPTLDAMSELMQQSSTEIEQLALRHRQAALETLVRSLAASTAILAIMSVAIWYVLRKIVNPLERLDQKLRGLIEDRAIPYPPRTRNEIHCLEEAIELVSHLWQEKTRLEGELRNFAFQDSLTQLPNRRLLMERLQHARVKNERRGQFACLLFLDLDKFKQINDDYGHEIGDELLVAVADRLKNLLREEDTIARLGGDEFIVLLDNLGADMAAAHEAAEQVRDKLDRELALPYEIEGKRLLCSASIGHKLFHGSGEDVGALIRAADADMYQCKHRRETA